jgi:hypothetical protein
MVGGFADHLLPPKDERNRHRNGKKRFSGRIDRRLSRSAFIPAKISPVNLRKSKDGPKIS